MSQTRGAPIHGFSILFWGMMCFLLSGGCAFRGDSVPLGGGRFPLKHPKPGSAVLATQHFRIERPGRVFQFDGHAEMEPGRIALVGLTPLGSRGFSLVWEGGSYSFEHLPFYRLPVKPGELLAAYQLIYWPRQNLEAHLRETGITLEETSPPFHERHIFYRGRPLIRIRYDQSDPWRGRAAFWHLRHNYTLTIDTIQAEPLSALE